jgi:hypothetical protein
MLKDVLNTILAIRTHIDKCKKDNSPVVAKYSGFITRALNGEFVYKGAIEEK